MLWNRQCGNWLRVRDRNCGNFLKHFSMSVFFSHPCSDFSGLQWRITISTGPVIIDSYWLKVLLHISSSTGKYQFIWWRLDDNLSFRENALIRAQEVIGSNTIILNENNPTVLLDTIERDGKKENILLIHFKARIIDEVNIGDARWFTLDQIYDLRDQDIISSPNVLICSEYFLKN